MSIQRATDHSSLKNCSRSKSKSIYIVSLLLKIIYSIINYTTSRGFNRSIQPSFWLFICSYLSNEHWVLCYWNSRTMVISLIFKFCFHKAKKEQELSFPTVYRVSTQNFNYGLRVCRFFCVTEGNILYYFKYFWQKEELCSSPFK